jgi:hypothetical protein
MPWSSALAPASCSFRIPISPCNFEPLAFHVTCPVSSSIGSRPTIQELQAAGRESLQAIAAGLDERGIPAARGGRWSAVQVSRLLEAGRPFDGVSVGGG